MRKTHLAFLGLAGLLLLAPAALAQSRPYIGFVYPAGGQQGTTFQVRLGGQGLDNVDQAVVSGTGVKAKVIDYQRRLSPQEIQLLREQLGILRKARPKGEMMAPMMMNAAKSPAGKAMPRLDAATQQLVMRIEERMATYVNRPACSAISNLVTIEVTIEPGAAPGAREVTLATPRGVSNPMVFHVGQFPEVCRKPMRTADFQVLGKEKLALRKRPADEEEQTVTLPCTLNGQIASGEINRYRFQARKGQRLVISCQARQLIPFVADAVPGWFQPVMSLHDASGREVAYADDYRFRPDPVILCEVPKDGEYVLSITDAIYRGREDFVYRVSVGELPFITSVFPLGGRAGAAAQIESKGWNLEGARLAPPPADAKPGTFPVTAVRKGIVSNTVPFELDALPEAMEKESNDDSSRAQKVTLPIIVNGRIDRPDDWDVFQFSGKAGQTVVAEVSARRLESPLDSFVRITDASGQVLAFNDDHADAEAGSNTHHADSYLTFKLPADGTYCVQLGDTARHGGEEYAYRLRISAPQPDFALQVTPTSASLRSKSSAAVTVTIVRKDGFNAPLELVLKDPPAGFSMSPVKVGPTTPSTRITIKTSEADTKKPVALQIEGRAKVQDRMLAHTAVPVEDRMQAFLWRHLVPAEALQVLVYDPAYQAPPKRVPKEYPPSPATRPASDGPPKFSKSQVASRLRQLKLLFEEGLLTDDFHHEKVLECEAAQ